ncbi:SDR family oxidoreductase [Tenuibacillus multivorans]|uniref:Short-chain dehydrogenase n=1 Tax=Tenuibacillus multivorans TaxID=237069 RepID=A0A1G9ZWQ5_9BACI|nr:SDR family oxidoreductase [Tenuibacillus multivorans]GEL76881.1 putative oxidoreductase YxnA [Tenuibacillus multivorans]SDN25648.1 Short-chain dehydrogenase [Tenuibacillus multivorans]
MNQNKVNQSGQKLDKAVNKTNISELDTLEVQPFRKINLKKLEDQVIVITGASSGIGLVTARMAASRGAKVVVAARNEEALRQLVMEFKENGYPATYVTADVGSEEDIKKIAETALNEFGRFDTWVNNAGVSIYGHAMDVSNEDIKRMFDTNFWSVVYGTKIAVKHFKERGYPGAIINVGSIFGDRGTVIQSTYAAAKFAVHGWTESIRMELEKEKAPVSVTLIHPGRIDTPYNEHARSYLNKQPAHRGMIYPPEAVAESILYSAEYPKRDMYIGSQAKITELLGTLLPRLTDKIMEVIMYPTQHANKPSKSPEESALYHAGYGLRERGTNIGWIRSRSLYVKTSKHPVVTSMIVAGLSALVWSRFKRKS